jgi:NADPH:quinone reductase-like Zn-dependent oxidoreductase
MRAWVLNGFGLNQLKLAERPIPKPAPHELLVSIRSVSLNYKDKLLYSGVFNPAMRFPMVPVSDAAGEVVDVGEKVTRFRAGDRIVTHCATRWLDGEGHIDDSVHAMGNTISGALAEYVVIDEQAALAKPDYLSDDEASTLPIAALAAWYALVDKGNLALGDSVLAQGTGGVSIFGLQLATALGAHVIVTSSSDQKLEHAKTLGAVHGINYSRSPEWQNEVLDFTAQRGVDHVLEVVGGENLRRSLAAVCVGGQISVIGVLQGVKADLDLLALFRKKATIRGIGGAGPRRAFEEMNKALATLKVRPVIDAVYPFEDALPAFRHLERGAFGKIVVRVRS